MNVTPIHQSILNHATELLLPYNESNEIPADVGVEIDRINDALLVDGLQIKVTRINDGIQKGWLLQFDKA